VIAADAAADKIEAVIVIEATFERCPLAHKSAPSFTVVGKGCPEELLSRSGVREVEASFTSNPEHTEENMTPVCGPK
jgi:hypothetical protein